MCRWITYIAPTSTLRRTVGLSTIPVGAIGVSPASRPTIRHFSSLASDELRSPRASLPEYWAIASPWLLDGTKPVEVPVRLLPTMPLPTRLPSQFVLPSKISVEGVVLATFRHRPLGCRCAANRVRDD